MNRTFTFYSRSIWVDAGQSAAIFVRKKRVLLLMRLFPLPLTPAQLNPDPVQNPYTMPVLQPIVTIAELLYQKGITDVVLSPGSRSAPLTLAVARHPHLRTRVMADERSACFVALGMARQSGRPVAVICTSGSAVYNLAPAVVEAFFGQTPLLLLTADRPHEWLHQQDGQTIDQVGVFAPM